MTRNVLIPTDFTIKSLSAVQALLSMEQECEMNVVLLHILKLENSVIELLFMNQFVKPYTLVSDEFEEACEVLKKKYQSRLLSLNIRFAYNDGKAYLKNVLESEAIDEIVLAETIDLDMPSKRSVEMPSLLKKLGYPIYNIPEDKIIETYTSLSALNIQAIKAY